MTAASPAAAQYFGRNKVQYRTFRFEVLRTEHFDIHFYPEGRQGIDIAARMAERWHARLSRLFDHELRGRQPLVLYASHPDFEQTNVIGGELGEGTGGVTEPVRRRIVLPLAGPLSDTDHVIGHELVHAFQFDIARGPEGRGQGERLGRLPLWFIEGMAEYLSLGPVDPNTAMWLRDALQHDGLPAIEKLEDPEYFPYRWGHAFWAYVAGRWGDGVIRQMLLEGVASGDTEATIQSVLGIDHKDLTRDWHEAIRQTYAPVLAGTTAAAELGRVVIRSTEPAGTLNVGPSLSPDGRWLAFLSERSFFGIDLYVADAASGRIVRRLTSTATDPHFTSLQFIHSAGAWDADSRRIAIATITGGRAALAIFEAASGRREREIHVSGVDEILNPAWSPDGTAIAFAGMREGLTDLYVVDVPSANTRRLTDDAYADLQPAWSPDGRRVAFTTDRFSTNLATVSAGPYSLALLDPATGVIERVAGLPRGQQINPQFSPDGRALYFIGDRDGVPNLYRVTLENGAVAQLTTAATGLSGITRQSPALSVAARSGLAAFSVYDEGRYDIYTLDPAGRGRAPVETDLAADVLPPADRRESEVARVLADATFGLPARDGYPVDPYRPRLSLEGISQAGAFVGANRFGPAFGGGLTLWFGDLLGNHTLGTAFEFNSGLFGGASVKDLAAQAAYLNQARRWNWGAVGGQLPYLSGAFGESIGTFDGELALLQQEIIYRQTDRSASGLAAYPFNRAARLELTGGFTSISFDQRVRTIVYSLETSRVLLETTETSDIAETLTLGTSSVAFVYDTANFGATSPVQGQRLRLEAAPTLGTIDFTGLLADYRRYVMPVPFYTLAFRGIHYGRYGGGGEDPRLLPLYLGYPTLVRGYDVNTFEVSECVPDATSSCPAFDRLLGSRLLVGNVELRFPLLRFMGVSRRMYGPLPVEAALFADGGVAWTRDDTPSIFGGERQGVSSVGVTFRVNLAGFAIGQFDIVRPLQRPRKGWMFTFNLAQGF
jgi:hypothetical protein